MRLTTVRLVRFVMASVGLTTLISPVIAQETPALEALATFSDAVWSLNIKHPEDWVTFSDEQALYLANEQTALDVIFERRGSLSRGEVGIILFAPSTVATLGLAQDSSNADALSAFLEQQALRSPSGEVYKGNPAVSFNVFPVQADDSIDFGMPLITNASVDALAFELEETVVFALLISRGDFFALSEAMWETLTLSPNDGSVDLETPSAEGDFELLVEDDGKSFVFSATLPAGWETQVDEETGQVILASSSAALEVATGEADAYERGDSALIISLPPALRALEINPFDSADLVFTAYAQTLGIEAYPSFVEGFEVFTAQGYIAGEALPGGQANLYAFGFPAGVVTVMVQDVLGASNPDVKDVLLSIQYAVAE